MNNVESDNKETCELVIHCHACKRNFQLNPAMIALALAMKTDLWEVYNAVLKYPCDECKKKNHQ